MPASWLSGSEIAVEVAWGADLTADPDTWSWSDITTDVLQDPGIEWTAGRSDEASTSQPASISMTLLNTSGDYSTGGESTNWPYVRQGTPVRVRIDPDGSGLVVAVQGEAVGWTPTWDLTGRIALVELTVAGPLRRLGQGQGPLQSSMFREVTADSRCVSYWPCEEGDRARAFAPAVGSSPMTWAAGPPDFASESYFECAGALPRLKGSTWTASVDRSNTGDWMVRFLAKFDDDLDSSGTAGSSVVTIFTSGTAAIWVLWFEHGDPSGTFTVKVYDVTGAQIYASTEFISFVCDPNMGALISISAVQNGADVDLSYAQSALLEDSANTFGFSDTITTDTCGNVISVWVNRQAGLDEVAIGHITVYDEELSFTDGLGAARAWRSEYADVRLTRLAEETGETATLAGVSWVTMGPQEPATLINLMREIEQADGGVLYDGETHGLSYRSRETRENRPPDLTLNDTRRQVGPPLQPVHDDQRIRNRAFVTRKAAGTWSVDASGNLAPTEIGIYDTSLTASLCDDNATMDLAGWIVHLGTVEGYRYPTVSVDLGANPELIDDVLALKPGYRIDIKNLDSVLTGHPGPSTLSLAVEGMTHRLNAMTWTVAFRCSRYDPWSVAVLDDESLSPVALIDVGAEAESNNTTLSVAPPDDYDVDDLFILVASIRNSGTGTVNTPTGWTSLLTFGNVSVFGFVQPREYPDWLAATTSVSFTGGAANATCLAQMFSVRGTAAYRLGVANTVHASATQLNGSAQDCAMPGLTVTEDNCGILAIVWKQDDFTSASNPYGYTDFPVITSSTLGDDACMFAAWGVQEAAANIASGTYTITGGAAAISRGVVLAFLPDPTPADAARYDTNGSTLNGSIAQGATSLSVTTTAGLASMAYRGAGAFAVADNASVVPALPTTWAAGDMFLAVASIRNSGTGTVNTPAGWTSLLTSGNLTLLGRVAQGGDTAPTVTFTGGVAGATTMAQCFAVRGLHPDTATVVANSAAQLNGSAQNIARPALTVPSDNCMVLLIWWKQDDSTAVANDISFSGGPANGSTTTGDDASTGADIFFQGPAANYSSGTLTVTGGASAISRCMMVALSSETQGTWTTDADDYPLDLDVGGVKVTATACSDAVSPQTMTIDAAPVARASGVPVKLWRPPALSRNKGL